MPPKLMTAMKTRALHGERGSFPWRVTSLEYCTEAKGKQPAFYSQVLCASVPKEEKYLRYRKSRRTIPGNLCLKAEQPGSPAGSSHGLLPRAPPTGSPTGSSHRLAQPKFSLCSLPRPRWCLRAAQDQKMRHYHKTFQINFWRAESSQLLL